MKDFLRVDANKTELFELLVSSIAAMAVGNKRVFSTCGAEVLSSDSAFNLANFSPCSHEEADARLILHAHHAANANLKNIAIRTVDSDVVVIAVSAYTSIGADQLWVHYGTGRNITFIPIHENDRSLTPLQCQALPFFHAFTGCDTVPFFVCRGKRTAWDLWQTFPDVTEAFTECLQESDALSPECVALLERFVILLFDRTSGSVDINEARKLIFTQKRRSLENVPPTKAALEQHIKRVYGQRQPAQHQFLLTRVSGDG